MWSETDTWFAWRPVRLGPLKRGPLAWLRPLWRNRTCYLGEIVTIYAELPAAREKGSA